MMLISKSKESKQPDGLNVGVLLPDVDLTYGAEVTLALRVGRDFSNGAKVRILLFHPSSLLSSLRSTVFIFEGSSDGASVGVLLSDLENPLGAAHLNGFVGTTLNSCFVGPWAAVIVGNFRKCYFWKYWNSLFTISLLVN